MKTKYLPGSKILMIFDGDCGFCRYWLVKWKKISYPHFDFETYQSATEKFKDIPINNFKKAVHLILKDGTVLKGAEAAYYTYYINGSLPILYKVYRSNAVFREISDSLYNWIARNRDMAFRITKVFFGKDPYKKSWPRLITIFAVLLVILMFLSKASI